MMLQQAIWWPNERVDLPDFENIQIFGEQDFLAYNQSFFTTQAQFIVSGFVTTVVSGLNVSVSGDDGVLLNTSPTGGNQLYLCPTGHGTVLPAGQTVGPVTLTDNSTNYIHIQVTTDNPITVPPVNFSTPALRVFWDPTLDSGQGGEFLQSVSTAQFLNVQLVINTTGFVVNNNMIPIASVVCAGGSAGAPLDARPNYWTLRRGQITGGSYNEQANFDFTLNQYTEPVDTDFSSADKALESFKDWMDLVMTQIKWMKFGVGSGLPWFATAGGNLNQIGDPYEMVGGGIFTWTLSGGAGSSGTLAFTANINFLIPGTAFTNTILLANSPITIPANDYVVYVTIVPTGNTNIVPVVVAASAYVPAPNQEIIVWRLSDAVSIGTS